MSKPIRIAAYNEQLIDCALRLAKQPRIELQLTDHREAVALRFEFYGLRRAIRNEQSEMFPDFMRAKLTINDSVLILAAPEKSNSGFSRALTAALATPASAGPEHCALESITTPANISPHLPTPEAFESLVDAWMNNASTDRKPDAALEFYLPNDN